MKIARLNDFVGTKINEAHKPNTVDAKDWDRMMDLYNRLCNGNVDVESIAKKINDVNKALARAVAGLRILMAAENWAVKKGNDMLSPEELKTYLKFSDLYDFTNSMWQIAVEKETWCTRTVYTYKYELCTVFLKKAAELGATEQEFYVLANDAVMPTNLLNKQTNTKDIVGGIQYEFNKIEKKYNIIIEYKHAKGTSAWSYETSHSYNHNGRCWPIAYEYTIYDSTKSTVISTGTFVDVTNEGGGRYGWDCDGYRVSRGGFKDVIDCMLRKAKII